jgi:hypothetical protein
VSDQQSDPHAGPHANPDTRSWPGRDDDTLARFEAMWERTRRAAEAARVARDRAEATARIESLVAELDRTVQELDGLRTAMRTRAAIEQAKGVIMGLNGCRADVAFAALVRLSQTSQHKLHDVATLIVSQIADGEDGRQAVIDLTRSSLPTGE